MGSSQIFWLLPIFNASN
jgi:hypothetical protein